MDKQCRAFVARDLSIGVALCNTVYGKLATSQLNKFETRAVLRMNLMMRGS